MSQETAERTTKMSRVMLGCGAAVLLGAVAPWVTGPSDSASGFTVFLGWLTGIGGVGLCLYAWQGLDGSPGRHHGWAIAAIATIVFFALAAYSILDDLNGVTFGAADPGWGLHLTFIAGLVAIWPLRALRRAAPAKEPKAVTTAPAVAGAASAGTSHLAGWHPDPMGRCDQRYYDGSNWTDRVTRNGEQGHDPLHQAAPSS